MSRFPPRFPGDAFSPHAEKQPMNSVAYKQRHINVTRSFMPPKAGFIFEIKAKEGGYVKTFMRVSLVFP